MKDLITSEKLDKSFYSRELLTVAKDLLGKIFVKTNGRNLFSGIIVETEAYHGDFDEAAHSFKGKTKRTEIMFEVGGYLYV